MALCDVVTTAVLDRALKKIGPCLSTELSSYLVHKHRLTQAAARKRVSRGAPGVKRLAHLTFAKSARFIYLQSQFGSSRYWHNLYAAIREAKGPYARALDAVRVRTAVPLEHFAAACGAPIAQRKQISVDAVRERLVKADVLEVLELPGIGPVVVTKQTADTHRANPESLAGHIRGRLIAESAVLGSIREWARKLGFASYNKVAARTGYATALPRVGPFAWDMTGPSYLTSTRGFTDHKVKPGWFVCDVLLARDVSRDAVEPFLNKVRAIKALPRIGRAMFMFVAEGYGEAALSALREEGAIPGTLGTIFGTRVATAFTGLAMLLEQAGVGSLDVSALGASIRALGEFDGAIGNLRGALFEFLVAELVRKRSAAEVKLHKICRGQDGTAEVDVWEVKEGIAARFIECKGVQAGHTVDDDEVKKWLNVRIKRIRYHLAHDMKWRGPRPSFEMWTSGQLSANAFAMFTKVRKASARKFDLKLVLPTQIRREAKSVHDKALLTLFENHFLPRSRHKR